MNTTFTRTTFTTAIVTTATSALLLLGAATAHAVGPIDSQLDRLPGLSEGRHVAGIGNPNDRPSIHSPAGSIGLGGPDTAPPQHN